MEQEPPCIMDMRILLSCYDNDLYNDILQDWYKVKKNTRADFGLMRTETLWMNYKVENEQMTMSI